ncbi:DUF5666 domain-containing protein [Nocardia sp. CDC160]|uniref:DUF5666 domain-containing protein n=1 Tax=Nocardia sp. CDC160 TaxID=3112166 RepID=UPI002DBCB7FF|nr:DUF5666 domain-containing protein [Nocardia sp. CDC160]MEC3913401.1 DUF5666 domain-containing protein [Nocardia sp. CDC160]
MTDSIPAADGSQPPRGRRRPGRLTLALVGSALGIAATLGLVACGSSSEHTAKGGQEQGPGGHRDGARGVGGTITTEGSGSWMITKRDGSTETVTISPTTEFGTKAKSETAAQFAVGDQIMVQGQESNGTITATRILHARDHGTPPGSATATPPATPAK